MGYGRNRLLFNSSVNRGAMSSAVASLGNVSRHHADECAAADERDELATLRSTNARLTRELAELKVREAQAQRLADRDGLTGLYNRRRMLELLESAITEAARQRQRVGLLFIDLNGFKAINDE